MTKYLRRAPDTATVEDLRNSQLHLVDRGTSPITLNATILWPRMIFNDLIPSEITCRSNF